MLAFPSLRMQICESKKKRSFEYVSKDHREIKICWETAHKYRLKYEMASFIAATHFMVHLGVVLCEGFRNYRDEFIGFRTRKWDFRKR